MLSKSEEDKLEEKVHPGIHKEIKKMAKKHHKFSHTHIEHHKDGSHTVHHVHEDGPQHDVKGAAGDHDAMMDHVMDHTAPPNPEMEQADAGQHGVPPEQASAAGLPTGGAPQVA